MIEISAFDIGAADFETSVTIEDADGGAEVQNGDAVLTLTGVMAADLSSEPRRCAAGP